MRILFIKPKHIGDSLILTPTIVAARKAHLKAQIWVLVRRGCDRILDGCPEIDHVLTLAPVEKNERSFLDFWLDALVLLRLRLVRFDYVFELGDGHRARLFAIASRTKRRYSVKPSSPLKPFELRRFTGISDFDWEQCHRIQKDFYSVANFIDLLLPIPPMRFGREFTRSWKPAHDLKDFAVVQIGGRQGFNCWNRDGWREVCRGLLDRFAHVVVSCGPIPHEIEQALWLQKELGSRLLCTRGKASWPEIAGLLYRAKLYVGLNTATMHLAAACRCPVVALFGPSIEDHWYPWQVPYRIVTGHGYVPLPDAERRYEQIKQRSMDDIQPGDVLAACDELTASVATSSP
ncbi:MAG TPA: glycosyltransferase family 9 protein [Candidatus Methylacidiphilales bacterium]|nr:glycosyltransferase family 9 protein [Candidatus Methylacidiphilales bacterium]